MILDPHKKQSLLKALQEAWEGINAVPVQKACATCVHFDVNNCQKWNTNPPEEIKKNGCESWEFDATSPPF